MFHQNFKIILKVTYFNVWGTSLLEIKNAKLTKFVKTLVVIVEFVDTNCTLNGPTFVIDVVLPMERSPVWSANKYIAVAGVFDVSKLLANLNDFFFE